MALHSGTKHPKTRRISVDLPIKQHVHMKSVLAYADIRVNQFIQESIEKNLKALEDKLDQEAYDQGKEDIRIHGTISWEEMKKRLGWDV